MGFGQKVMMDGQQMCHYTPLLVKTALGAGVVEGLEKQLLNTGPVPERFTYYKNGNRIGFRMIDEVIKKRRD